MTFFIPSKTPRGWRIFKLENGIEVNICGAADEDVAVVQSAIFKRLADTVGNDPTRRSSRTAV